MATMKIGKAYIDFYEGQETFYELDLRPVRADNRQMWIDHISRKRWFVQDRMLDRFIQALDNWLARGDARKSA